MTLGDVQDALALILVIGLIFGVALALAFVVMVCWPDRRP